MGCERRGHLGRVHRIPGGALRVNARISFATASTAARYTGRSSGASSLPTPGPLELTQSSDAAHPAPAGPATSTAFAAPAEAQRPHRRGGDPSSPALHCDERGWCNNNSWYPPPSRSVPTAVLVTCRRSRGMVRPDPCVDWMDLARSRLDEVAVGGGGGEVGGGEGRSLDRGFAARERVCGPRGRERRG